MAINVNVSSQVGQGPDLSKEAALQKQQVTRPSTAVERLLGEGPTQQQEVTVEQPKSYDYQHATEADLADPTLRSAGPQGAGPVVGKELSPTKQQEIQEFGQQQTIQPLSKRVGLNAQIDDNADPFGQVINRADRFTTLFHDKLESGATVKGAYEPSLTTQTATEYILGTEPKSPNILIKDVLFDPAKMNAGITREGGVTQVDPQFGRLMGYVTESFVGGEFDSELQDNTEFEEESVAVEETRYQGASQLGREIFKEWQRELNAREGKPSDEYDEAALTNDEYTTLGALAKEMYAAANPEMYKRVNTPSGQAVFQMTPLGQTNIRKGRMLRPDAFISSEIPPSPSPRQDLEKELGKEPETQRRRKIKTTSVDDRNFAKLKKVHRAIKNANSIAHVVDPQRRKIMFQYGLMAIKAIQKDPNTGAINFTSKVGDLFDVGPAKLDYFRGEYRKKLSEDPDTDYNPENQFTNYVSKFLEAMNTAARYSNKTNHLDYAVQELQTRMHVTQTRFNPQGNKWLRFVTGGAKPTTFKVGQGSSIDKIFRESIAAKFIPGADKLLPNKRLEAFSDEWRKPNHGAFNKYIQYGKLLKDQLPSNDLDNQGTQLISNIRADGNALVLPPQLQQSPDAKLPPELAREIHRHGDEAPYFIEAMMELDTYANGGTMTTNMNVEFDGKTHGPATNMAQLGIERGAYRTGVLRKEGATKNLDDFTINQLYNGQETTEDAKAGDIRDGMRDYMLENGQVSAENFTKDTELTSPLYRVLQEAVTDRNNYLKKPPMTLGYGQLIRNLRGAVADTVYSGPAATKIKQILDSDNGKVRRMINSKIEKEQVAEDYLIQFLHNILSDAINSELDPQVVAVGQTLRANNIVAMLSNEVMTVKNAIGYDNYIGAKQLVPKIVEETGEQKKGRLNVQTAEGKGVASIPLTKSVPAGSATREGKPGGWGRGRVIPAVIQGVDGAWMNKMFTDSWDRLRGGYMLPIMDAVKTDLKTAAAVRDEANKNWWNVIQDYSYVDEIMGKWSPNTIQKFRDKLKSMPEGNRLDITEDSEFRGFGWLLEKSGKPGKEKYNNLINTLYDTLEYRTKKTDETISEYEGFKKRIAQQTADAIFRNVGDRYANADKMSPVAMLSFFNKIVQALNLESRNKRTISETEARRKNLFSKARGSQILQIDL